VVEDATDIILNLKQVPIQLNNDRRRDHLPTLTAGVVTSARSEEECGFRTARQSVYNRYCQRRRASWQIECASRERPRLRCRRPRKLREDLALVYIPVTAFHSPVRKVNYSVESHFRKMTDTKLMIESVHGPSTPAGRHRLAAKLVKDAHDYLHNIDEPPENVECRRISAMIRGSNTWIAPFEGWSFPCALQLPKNATIPDHPRARAKDRKRNAEDFKNFGRKCFFPPPNVDQDILVKMVLTWA